MRISDRLLMKSKRIFLVSPVRQITPLQQERLGQLVEFWESQGCRVHWPLRDTNQSDPVGLKICQDNRKAIRAADLIVVAWDKSSAGSLFDLGMAFAMRKNIVVLTSVGECKPTKGKSFENMLLAWER